jgi:hypothetical protein
VDETVGVGEGLGRVVAVGVWLGLWVKTGLGCSSAGVVSVLPGTERAVDVGAVVGVPEAVGKSPGGSTPIGSSLTTPGGMSAGVE